MRRFVSTISALAVAAGALYAGAGSAGAVAVDRGKTPTSFAFKASGYGTKVVGGEVTAGSETTAFQAFGCSNDAGIDKRNFVASASLPGAGVAEGVRTRLWTTQKDGVVTTRSSSSVARVRLSQDGLGVLELNAIKSLARTWHDAEGFHAEATTTVGSILLTPPVGDPQEIPIPTPDQPVEIPGLATITLGAGSEQAGSDSAKALADGIRIDVAPSATEVRVAHTRAKLERGVRSGLFRGHSFGISASAADDNLAVGRNPLALMPCQGTEGKERAKSLALVNLGDNVVASGLSVGQLGEQTRRKASGYERGRVAELDLGGGALNVKGIVGQVNVKRVDGELKRNINGTELGTLTVQGEVQEFPDTDVLEIPGVARLERAVVDRTRHGISVVALRVTLLDGTGAVLNLGVANLSISPASR